MKKLEEIKLKNSQQYNERWVQDRIAEDPSILGLGNLQLRTKEKIQPSGGRLDLLLEDVDGDTRKRYECELQLGATDESHIIRTIEYWDVERKRYPQLEHAAVLVAEEVTGRFLNVIHLFNGHIPLIVLKMTAYKVGEDIALTFTKILDEVHLGTPEEDEEAEPTDRQYWEKRSTPKVLKLADSLFAVVKELEPGATMNYNKYYIGTSISGISNNFVYFKPKKSFVKMIFKGVTDESEVQKLEEVGLDAEAKPQWNCINVKLSVSASPEQVQALTALAKLAHHEYGLS